MLFEYIFVYLMIDVFCLLFSFVIYSKITIDMGTEREVRALRMMLIGYDLFLVTDAVWAMGLYGVLPMSAAAIGIIEAVTLLLMGFVAYCWFLYVEYKLHARYAYGRYFAFIVAIPVALVLLLYATTRFTGLIYTIGPDASFTAGPLELLPLAVFLAYVVFTTIHALMRFIGEKSSVRRAEIAPLVLFGVRAIGMTIAATLEPGLER